MFVLRRARDPVREATRMQDKLLLRPDLKPVVNWCMAWIQEARRQGVLPTFENMKNAWASEQARNPTNAFFNGLITPKHASQQCGVAVVFLTEHIHPLKVRNKSHLNPIAYIAIRF